MASQQWWIVYYSNLGSVSSRYDINPVTSFQVVQAASSAAAKTTVQNQLGSGIDITSVDGPYATKAAATAGGNGTRSQEAKATQAGSIPGVNILGALGQASTWERVAEVALGLALIIVGLAKLASGTPVGKLAIKAGETAAIL